MIPVTKPFIPPIEQYESYLQGVWERNWMTNNGPLVNDLELKLKRYFELKHLLYVSNGTIALQIAIKALGLTKEVITTPFSYVATTSSLVWEGCNPVFVDIDPESLNIDPDRIEEAITENTQAILATHCFGNPCNVETIDKIAKKNELKVIYDAAHCFGTKINGKSVFSFGDISTTSFHATKIYHTVEGGAVFTPDPTLLRRMALLRNFGHDGPEVFNGVGINGKNSEFHAAMGLCNLDYVNKILDVRKKQCNIYDHFLQNLNYRKPSTMESANFNHAYYPIILDSEEIVLKMKASLEKSEIYPRRYFYPSLSSLNYVDKKQTPIADDISSRILCLPLYHTLSEVEQELIARILLRTQNY